MAIKNYTTEVNMHRTVAELQQVLGAKGARFVSVDYDANGNPAAVRFGLLINDHPVPFRLPCNVEGVYRALQKARGKQNYYNKPKTEKTDRNRAPNIAWRIVKDWVEAQLALVEAEQAQMAEVFLPYAVSPNGTTMFEMFLNQHALTGTTQETA